VARQAYMLLRSHEPIAKPTNLQTAHRSRYTDLLWFSLGITKNLNHLRPCYVHSPDAGFVFSNSDFAPNSKHDASSVLASFFQVPLSPPRPANTMRQWS
jgi:hypothetical protein